MDDQPTCGQGLAEHSELPAKVAELFDAMGDILEFHQTTLDLTDENARKEHEAYVSLSKAYRGLASQLQMTAREMASYRDLPMARHDQAGLMSPEAVEVFQKYVNEEEDLLNLLQGGVERDQKMLAEMREFT
jgi:hypothetical protein